MKALILTCTMGQGHNSAAKAVYEAMRQKGIECEIVDAMSFGGKHTSSIVSASYKNTIVKMPGLFGYIYKAGKFVSGFHFKSPVYFANTLYAERLLTYIRQGAFDVAVCSHLFPMEALTYLKLKKGLSIKCYGIITDYTCIPFTEETLMDAYFIPHQDTAGEFTAKKIPESKLLPFGIPVSSKFCGKTPKAQARERLGLPAESPVFLVMTGGEGCGKTEDICKGLVQASGTDARVIVLIGRNETLKSKLHQIFGNSGQVQAVSFTEDVQLYMDACDVLLTKPGGLSSTEAAVKNVPLVHTRPIPGCETKNAQFFSERGLSWVAESSIDAAQKAVSLYRDFEACTQMLLLQRKHINPHAAEDICSYLLDSR